MKGRKTRWWLLLPTALVLSVTACAKDSDLQQLRTDHEALRARYELLLTQLGTWTQNEADGGTRDSSIVTWGQLAGRAICDIMSANPPNSKYAQATRDFCGAGDPPPGEPGNPPDWGN